MKTSTDFWMLVAMACYLLAVAARAVVMWRLQGVNPFVLGQHKRGWAAILELLFPWLGALWIVEVVLSATRSPIQLFPVWMTRPLFQSEALSVAGLILAFGSLAFFVWALVSFGESWRVGIDDVHPGSLVTQGAFALTRNPIFLAMDLFVLATFLVIPSLALFGFFLFVCTGIHLQILDEERFLRTHYGEEYDDYVRRTPRYLCCPLPAKRNSLIRSS